MASRCKVPLCPTGPKTRGLCGTHYQRWINGELPGVDAAPAQKGLGGPLWISRTCYDRLGVKLQPGMTVTDLAFQIIEDQEGLASRAAFQVQFASPEVRLTLRGESLMPTTRAHLDRHLRKGETVPQLVSRILEAWARETT